MQYIHLTLKLEHVLYFSYQVLLGLLKDISVL